MEDMDKKEIKEVIEWCDEKGHSEHEILDLGMQKGRWTCQSRPNCKTYYIP